jgi:hypothetical protein
MDTRSDKNTRVGVRPEYIVNFSDLTVYSTPVRRPEFFAKGLVFFQLLGLVHAQVVLVHEEGTLVRGGITIGEVVKSHRQLFGPGVIDAYRLESTMAKYPRIVVNQSVLDELATNANLWVHDRDDELDAVNSLLRRDEEDGLLYVDYLRVIRGESEGQEFDDLVFNHDALIKKGLHRYSTDIGVRPKYEWLRRYHDSTMRAVGSI